MQRPVRAIATAIPYLAPNFLGFVLFMAFPVLAIFLVAFTEGEYTSRIDADTGQLQVDAQWVGAQHFTQIAKGLPLALQGDKPPPDDPLPGDPEFWYSLWNTFVLLLAIPLQIACALCLALLLNQKFRGRTVYRTLLFLPTVSAGIALYMVWRQIYNPDYGLLNRTLEALGLFAPGEGPNWLGDPLLAKPAILIMLVWIAMGGTNMILYLAGLQDIDPSLYEAAEIDGAGPWDMFRHITWPSLRPTTFFILTTNLIGGIQIFDQVLIMTEGGPQGSTSTVLYYIYRNIYEYQGKMGFAAAMSVVLFLIVFGITLVNWSLNRKAREG